MRISIYRAFPPRVQNAVRLLYSLLPSRLRMGTTYWKTKQFLIEAQLWTREQIEQWQWRELQKVIGHAYAHVPGYYQLYTERGIKPGDLQHRQDLGRLPFVSKELLRDNLSDFTARNIPEWKCLYRTTSGSTGIPFGFYLTQDNIEREMAFLHTAWERVGWKLGEVSAVLRGSYVGSEQEFFAFDPFLRELKLSTYYLTQETYPKYKKKILDMRPRYLQAYPSAAGILADFVLQYDDAGKLAFELILLGSENIYLWQQERLRQAFPSARQFGWYGHAEQVLFAPMCQRSEQFHLDPFYGVSELLDEHDQEVGQGGVGELVGSSLWNYATPFIRYRTMDVATRGARDCARCGRPYQLLEHIDGRLQEMIVTRNGRYVSMTQINMHSSVFDSVKQFQFLQKEPGKVTLNLVRRPGFTDTDAVTVRTAVCEKLGEDVDLDLVFVDAIARPQSGKFRFLIQELPLKYGDKV